MNQDHFKPWSKQEKVLYAVEELAARIIFFLCGIQAGKTTVGVYWLFRYLMKYRDPADNFIITSPTFRILEQSTLPPFLRLMDGFGVFNKQSMTFRMHDGGTVWMRTGVDADSIVGITRVRAILADEIGLYSLYFWTNILARAAFMEAPILGVSSPYAQNWLYKDFVRHLEKNPNAIEGVLLVQARSDENPYFPKGEIEHQRKLMDERRWRQLYGGEWGRMEGLVYDCFDDSENTCPTLPLPAGTTFYAGVDWGVRHAFVIHVRAVTPDGLHYQVAEVYRTGLNPLGMVQAAIGAKLAWGIKTFFADPSQPGMIDLFCAKGCPTVGAENDIKLGIGYHYELIKTRKFKIFDGVAPYSLDQYSTYHYPSPKDLKPDQSEKAIVPVKVNDDALDAARYCTIAIFHLTDTKRPKQGNADGDVNKMSHDQVIELRKRKQRRDHERWS